VTAGGAGPVAGSGPLALQTDSDAEWARSLDVTYHITVTPR
jgi:hypothetical protein